MSLDLPAREDAYFKARRNAIKTQLPDLDLPAEATGIALSGGGIRSATLSLGVLVALSRDKLIHQLDFLSTVSGGGYTGGFYGSMFVKPQDRGANAQGWDKPSDSHDPLGTPFGKAAIRHLRDNGRYLLDGAGDTVRLMVVTVRGWLAIQLVIGITLLAICLTAKWIQALLANMVFSGSDANMVDRGWSSLVWPETWLHGYPLGEGVVLSWLWPIAAIFLAVGTMAGWAFWLTRLSWMRTGPLWRFMSGGFLGTLPVMAACLIWPLAVGGPCLDTSRAARAFCTLSPPVNDTLYYTSLIIGGLAAGALFFHLVAELLHGGPSAGASDSPSAREARVRSRLTSYATAWVTAAAAFALIALIDSAAQSLYRLWFWDYRSGISVPLTGGALVAAATPFVRSVIEWAQTSGPSGPRLRRYGRTLALALAIALVLIIGVFWATLAEYIAWRGGRIGGGDMPIIDPKAVRWSMSSVAIPAIGFTLAAAAIGLSPGYLNLSTFGAFYASRLRRAYLGASNTRIAEDGTRREIETDDLGDDIALDAYFKPGTGAPLHLINVTLNETTGRHGSNLVQRDRKGRPLTISPAGFLVGGKEI